MLMNAHVSVMEWMMVPMHGDYLILHVVPGMMMDTLDRPIHQITKYE
jgi:hypothetical protein